MPSRPARPSMSISIPSATCRKKPSACTGSRPNFSPASRNSPRSRERFSVFLGDAALVAHNAEFDMRFINAELSAHGHDADRISSASSTLWRWRAAAIRASPNSLDALCQRYGIDASRRTKHGALLDAEILGRGLCRTDRRPPGEPVLCKPSAWHAANGGGAAASRPAALAPLDRRGGTRGACGLHRAPRQKAIWRQLSCRMSCRR